MLEADQIPSAVLQRCTASQCDAYALDWAIMYGCSLSEVAFVQCVAVVADGSVINYRSSIPQRSTPLDHA